MARGSIVKRGNSYRVVVPNGRDPITKKKRQLTRTYGTIRDAEDGLVDLLRQAQRPTATSAKTFGDLLDRWFESSESDWSPSTVLENRRIKDKVIIPVLGDVRLDRLEPSDLDAFYGHLRKAGGRGGRPLSGPTVRRVHTVVRSALEQGVKWRWLEVNPASSASPPKDARREVVPPTPDEVTTLVTLAERDDPLFYLFLHLAVVTGARRGELCALRWSDLADRTLTIERSLCIAEGGITVKSTKSGKPRRLTIDPATTTLVAAQQAVAKEQVEQCGGTFSNDAYIFTSQVGGQEPWTPRTANRRFDRLRKKVGLETVNLHHLRHFVATQLLAAGLPLTTVSQYLGHSSPTTTLAVYAHYVDSSDRKAAQLLSSLLAPAGDASALAERGV